MAAADEGHRRGHLRYRHAAAGHPEREGPDGNVHCGPGAANFIVCGAERTGEYPQTAGAGHRRRQGKGRTVRQAAQAAAGGVSQGLSAVESREDHRHRSGGGMRYAAVDVPV